MTEAQFTALAQLLRLRGGAVAQAVQLHLVQGLPIGDAARQAGVAYKDAWRGVQAAQAGLRLAALAVGPASSVVIAR